MDQVIQSVASDINDSQSVVNLEYDQYDMNAVQFGA